MKSQLLRSVVTKELLRCSGSQSWTPLCPSQCLTGCLVHDRRSVLVEWVNAWPELNNRSVTPSWKTSSSRLMLFNQLWICLIASYAVKFHNLMHKDIKEASQMFCWNQVILYLYLTFWHGKFNVAILMHSWQKQTIRVVFPLLSWHFAPNSYPNDGGGTLLFSTFFQYLYS